MFAPPARLQPIFISLLRDPRDAPLLWLFLDVACTSLPAAVVLLALPASQASHAAGAAYFVATYIAYLQRFMLTLHFSEHRPLFKSGALPPPFH